MTLGVLTTRIRLLWKESWYKLLRVRFAMSDQDIQILESQFPAMSGSAFASARERVLASGHSVLQSQDGVIYEVFPNGSRVQVKQIEPPTAVVPGSVYHLR